MKNIITISLGVGILLAARPVASGTVPAAPAAVRPAGRALVLDTEKTLTGDIERVGQRYRIKRLIGETWIPASKVLTVCATLEEAYLFLQRRANLNDPAERLRLSDWCRQHGLQAQALAEMKAAAALKPGDERLTRMVTYLQESQTKVQAPATPAAEEPPAPRMDVAGESLRLFATRVQPVLMNACARCHCGGRGGAFQLTRVYGPGLANRKSLEKNLAASLAQVNFADPRTSKLLIKALSLHAAGMSKEPLPSRQAPAFRSLEEWVLHTVENNPHLREQASAAKAESPWPPAPQRPEGAWGEDRSPKAPHPVTPAATPGAPPLPAPPPPPPAS